MSIKLTSLRLDEELATELKAVARAEGVPVSEAIRAALYQYIATCRADPGFQARFLKQLEEEREALERLASWGRGAHKGISGSGSAPHPSRRR